MKFPKEILVQIERDTDGSEYEVITSLTAAADPGRSVKVARYRLVEVGAVTAEPTFVPGRTATRKPR